MSFSSQDRLRNLIYEQHGGDFLGIYTRRFLLLLFIFICNLLLNPGINLSAMATTHVFLTVGIHAVQ